MKYLLSFVICFCCALAVKAQQQKHPSPADYADVMYMRGMPETPKDTRLNFLSDMGAWHAFALPAESASDYFGSFTGPFVMEMNGRWLAKALVLPQISVNAKSFDFKSAKAVFEAYPGMLLQSFETAELCIRMQLIFATNRSSLVEIRYTSKTDKTLNIETAYTGQLWLPDCNFVAGARMPEVRFKNSKRNVSIQADDIKTVEYSENDMKYRAQCAPFGLKKHQSVCKYYTLTHCFDEKEKADEVKALRLIMNNPASAFSANQKRWSEMLAAVVNTKNPLSSKPVYRDIAIRSVQTLLTNWRSKAGALRHDGVFPSAYYQGFYGFWAWDSWKHAYALAQFHPQLAKSSLLSMFDFQNKEGMIADCVYFDSTENNWRNTKPPLAAWAVEQIYRKTGDKAFVQQIFPKLKRYHNWWYRYRDGNRNGVCEFGSTDGTLVAAAWESGMDNAIRFDSTKISGSDAAGWTMDQESVDLNTFLYAEKKCLAYLAQIISETKTVTTLEAEAEILKKTIVSTMFDEKTGFFQDRKVNSNELIPGMGPEGWLPLWAGIANKHQAEAVLKAVSDSTRFASYVPFPTIEAKHPQFDPKNGYWRGPVWLDQAWFAVSGLYKYHYKSQADKFVLDILNHAEGLQDPKAAIRENYHPITGAGLNARHFSWSAAHLLMLISL